MKIKKYLIHNSIYLILIVAAILRLWKLGSIPPGLTPDEASLGYNAYSILKTGRDEYGKLMPIIFKSFGDYKPGLYVYLTVPFVAVLGLNEFAVRLPSALSGVVAVWIIYKLVGEFLSREKLEIENWKLKIMPAIMLAINPWHILFSRGAWEANISLTLTLAGLLFFLKSLRKPKYLIFSALFFASTLLTYQGAKLSTLIVVISLVLAFWGDVVDLLKNNSATVVKSSFIALVVISPILLSMLRGQIGRLEVFSVFSYPRSTKQVETLLAEGGKKLGSLDFYLFHSETLNFKRAILGRYFNHFSSRFLFFEGDWQNPRHNAPYQGMLLMIALLLLPAGLVALVKRRDKLAGFVIFWLLLAPLPAVLTRDEVQAVRSLNMVIPLALISGFGFCYLFKTSRKQRFFVKMSSLGILSLLFIASFVYFVDAYFVHLPIHDAKYWDYGYKQAVENITPIQNKHKKIIFQQSYNQPYIYFLFYQKYDPAKYQKIANLKEGGVDVGLVENLDNIEFRFFSWPTTDKPGSLIVGDTVVIPNEYSRKDYKLISDIYYPGGDSVVFRILEVK